MKIDWKEYYAKERLLSKDKIIANAQEHWHADNSVALDMAKIVRRGGITSFPHTFLADSMLPLMNVIKSMYLAGKRNVIALGVLHGISADAESLEFSLDGLVEIAKLYADVNRLESLSITKSYHPPLEPSLVRSKIFLDLTLEISCEINKAIKSDAAVVMTGDIVHYGWGYGTTSPMATADGLQETLRGQVLECLNALYCDGNVDLFIERSYSLKNDQIGAAILANMLLPHPVAYKVFSFSLSDYVPILQSQSPTVVASICYGVFPIQ